VALALLASVVPVDELELVIVLAPALSRSLPRFTCAAAFALWFTANLKPAALTLNPKTPPDRVACGRPRR
jgi:hypothetical protein